MIRQRTIKTDFFAIGSSSNDDNHQDKAPDCTQMTVYDSLLQRIRRPSILFTYVCTWILFYLLVHYTEIGASMGKVKQEHKGNSIPVAQVVSSIFFVVCVEVIKILVSAGLYLIEDPQHTLVNFCAIPFLKSLLIQYIPTAVLYAIYNNLMFFNLRTNLPTAYLIISASRLGMTAVAWQMYFKDGDMTLMRKLAIVIITLGIFTRGIAEEKVIDVNHTGTDAGNIMEISYYHHYIGSAILILFQILCSVLAGIYNEKLLKNDTCSQHLQNICLYLNSIAVNIIIGTVIIFINISKGESVVMDLEMKKLVSPTSILIIFTLSMAGIMSSMVLRYENSITKCVASASETVFTSLIEYFWFGHVYRIPEILCILLVSSGTILYSIPPSDHKFKITRALKLSKSYLISFFIMLYIITLGLCHISYQTHVVKESKDIKRYLVNFLRNQPNFCTEAASFRPRPVDVTETKYRHVYKAEEVMKYIIKKLETIGAPVSLMYGTLLHEFRNGTGTCVQPNLYDKDFDIALFEMHFYAVEALSEEIKKIFDWKILYVNKERLFMIFAPPGLKAGKGYQIDVYGFKSNHPRKGLIYFPWDEVAISMDASLPIVKHKTVVQDDDVAMNFRTVGDNQRLYYHIPFNVPCLLSNMYGPDFMTPKKGHFIRKTAYDNPKCDRRVLTVAEQIELERQLTFTEKSTSDVIPSTKMKKMEQNRHKKNVIAKKNDAGIITCVRSREDAVFALELANRFQELRYNGSANLALELYHFASISPFLTAQLELIRGVEVIEIENTSNDLKHCVSYALSMTRLTDILVVEPSLIFLHRSSNLFANENVEKKISPLLPSLKDQTQQQPLKLICSVISTSANIDDALQFAKLQKSFRFQQVYLYQSTSKESTLEKQDIFSRNGLEYVGSMNTGNFLFDFLYPDAEILRWSSYYYTGQLICQRDGSTPTICPGEVTEQVESTLRRYRNWLTILLLDRPLGWIAFEGGLVKKHSSSLQTDGCASFNSVEAAKKSARFPHSSEHKTIMNIDLIMTSDKENFAMHSESSFGPIHCGRKILHPPSLMAMTEVQNSLRNPCLSNEFIHEWFDDNQYRSYATCDECSLGISSAGAFLNDIVLKDEVPIIFDLKLPDGEKQETQAQQILSLIFDASRSESDVQKLIERVGIRYFAVGNDGSISLEALPSQLRKKILMPKSPTRILKVYINAPSKVACLQLAQWANDQGTHIEGCFVIQGHVSVATSWRNAERELNISKTLRNTQGMKLICNVPREQAQPDTRLWKKGLVSCLEDGYDWIHQPFPVASEADYSAISNSMLASITVDGTLIANKLSVFSVMQLGPQLRSKFQYYVSHWGVTSPYHWKPHKQHFSFVGDRQSSSMSSQSNGHIFRCVTKILTVMLFLRFEEIGLLSIDDTISSSVTKVTWKHVFSNTAGADGSHAGKKFEYSNSLWSHVSDFVEKLTGVSFVEAISFYILSPMGLSGYFEENTPYPPFTARGFRGSNEDLLVIGSTLASGGVSPKTRMRVISMSSVEKMLRDWTSEQNVIASFLEDKTVKNMNRFCSSEKDDSFSSYGIVDGYGMGLWRVKGWRTRGDTTYAVRGWLSMGSSEAVMYFDEDSIVVGMCSQNRTSGLELTAPFASIVKEIGSRISNAFMSRSRWERTDAIQ